MIVIYPPDVPTEVTEEIVGAVIKITLLNNKQTITIMIVPSYEKGVVISCPSTVISIIVLPVPGATLHLILSCATIKSVQSSFPTLTETTVLLSPKLAPIKE